MFSIPLMVSEAFSMLVIAAQIAALDPSSLGLMGSDPERP